MPCQRSTHYMTTSLGHSDWLHLKDILISKVGVDKQMLLLTLLNAQLSLAWAPNTNFSLVYACLYNNLFQCMHEHLVTGWIWKSVVVKGYRTGAHCSSRNLVVFDHSSILLIFSLKHGKNSRWYSKNLIILDHSKYTIHKITHVMYLNTSQSKYQQNEHSKSFRHHGKAVVLNCFIYSGLKQTLLTKAI